MTSVLDAPEQWHDGSGTIVWERMRLVPTLARPDTEGMQRTDEIVEAYKRMLDRESVLRVITAAVRVVPERRGISYRRVLRFFQPVTLPFSVYTYSALHAGQARYTHCLRMPAWDADSDIEPNSPGRPHPHTNATSRIPM